VGFVTANGSQVVGCLGDESWGQEELDHLAGSRMTVSSEPTKEEALISRRDGGGEVRSTSSACAPSLPFVSFAPSRLLLLASRLLLQPYMILLLPSRSIYIEEGE